MTQHVSPAAGEWRWIADQNHRARLIDLGAEAIEPAACAANPINAESGREPLAAAYLRDVARAARSFVAQRVMA